MSESPRDDEPLLDLLLDGALGEEDAEHLARLLRDDEDARQRYVDHMLLHSALRPATAWPDLQESGLGSRAGDDASKTSWRLNGGRGLLAASVAGVVLLAIVSFAMLTGEDRPLADVPNETVAVLQSEREARWDAMVPLMVGDRLETQTLRLTSGVAEVAFDNGAVVTIEGPCEFVIAGPDHAFLRQGRVQAYVPEEAQGFVIDSVGFKVVDLGTRFVAEVDATGAGRVGVIDGEVELLSGDASHRLFTGQGSSIDTASRVAALVNVDDLLNPSSHPSYRRWLAHTQELRKDQSLLLYYTFESIAEDTEVVKDLSGSGNDGRMQNVQPGTGRLTGKPSAELREEGSGIATDIPGSYEALTMAMWVNIDAVTQRHVSLVQTDGYDHREPHWNFSDDGTMTLGISGAGFATSSPLITSTNFGRWMHLAAVWDGETGAATLYMDGRPVRIGRMDMTQPVILGPARIGNWNVAARPVRGRIDEVAIWERALDAEEIRELHAIGADR